MIYVTRVLFLRFTAWIKDLTCIKRTLQDTFISPCKYKLIRYGFVIKHISIHFLSVASWFSYWIRFYQANLMESPLLSPYWLGIPATARLWLASSFSKSFHHFPALDPLILITLRDTKQVPHCCEELRKHKQHCVHPSARADQTKMENANSTCQRRAVLLLSSSFVWSQMKDKFGRVMGVEPLFDEIT